MSSAKGRPFCLGLNVLTTQTAHNRHTLTRLLNYVFWHDDVIKWKNFPRYWPFVKGIHRAAVDSPHKGSDAELWCFLWSAPEQTVAQAIETPVIWDAIAFIMTSL